DTKLRSWLPQQTFMNCTKLTDVVFDKKVLTIHKATFSNTGFTEITIPYHIATVSDSAFAACANLTKVVLEENVTYLGWQALAGCAKLTDVSLPSTLVTFGARAFASCYELEEITLPQNTTKLPADLLFGCTALKSVDWSHLSVTDVPSRAVYKCLALTEVKLPETIKTIGKLAFYNCRTLPTITIPANVTTITEQAFNYCLALKTVYIDSATVVKGLTSRDAMGELIRYADTVAINASITDVPAYITDTFTVVGTETVNGVEYVTYSLAE
ncbi:MAG: leucine-rich repeat protein, partial [Clostridia bacterium]|nr:leucine-rich repeat protein [Clostridia bacterium]